MAYADLREYLAALDRAGKLFHVRAEVEREWEIAAVTRRVFQRIPEKDRPGLIFEHVKGSDIPVTVGILGASREVYALALECRVDEIADRWADAQDNPLEPEPVASGPVKQNIVLGDQADVTRLPVSTWTVGQDAGPFLNPGEHVRFGPGQMSQVLEQRPGARINRVGQLGGAQFAAF